MSKNCNTCLHKKVCKDYPNSGLPPKCREKELKKSCKHYISQYRPLSFTDTKKAKWKETNEGFYICSACNDLSDWKHKHCPNCGTKMIEG